MTEDVRTSDSPKPKRFRDRLIRFIALCGYLLFLTVLVLGLLAGMEYYAYRKILSSPLGAPYKDRGLDAVRQSSQKIAPLFGYEPTPGFAATRNTKLGNAYEYINNQSFKDFEDVPLEKPADEFRIIVTGGSVIYGRGPVPPADAIADFYEVTYRWTIPHIMEKLLNTSPEVREKIGGKKVRVINAGVPGHVIQNNLMRYLAKLRMYQPDVVVSLDGANDMHTVAKTLKDWNYFTQGQYYEVVSDILDMSGRGLANYLALWLKRNSYFFAWLSLRRQEGAGIIREDVGIPAHFQDPTPEMLPLRDRNIAQVADVAAIYHRVLETDRVPHVLALQPMFRNSKKKRNPMEAKIEATGSMMKVGFFDARETYDLLVDRIKKRLKEEGYDVVDLTEIFDTVTEWVFTDWCHLTNGANYILAKALTNEVKQRVFHLPLQPDDRLKQPLDSYFRDYAKDAKVLVQGKSVDPELRILKGYPGPEVLHLAANDINPAGVMLDLGAVVPISRLRIVWADEKSVPEAWRIDVSRDGRDWQPWLSVTKTEPDHFDQWPGFEYYAPGETEARFARYVPEGKDASNDVKLRQISLFR